MLAIKVAAIRHLGSLITEWHSEVGERFDKSILVIKIVYVVREMLNYPQADLVGYQGRNS